MFRRFFGKKLIFLPLIFIFAAGLSFAQNYNDLDELEEMINRLKQEQEEKQKQQEEQAAQEEPELPEVQEEAPENVPEEVTEEIPEENLEDENLLENTPETDTLIEESEETPQEEVLPEEEAPQVESAEPQEEVAEPQEEKSQEENTQAQEEKHKYEALAMIRYKNTDSISFRLKFSYIPKPYILGISFSAGYTAYRMIQPFYFGGYIEPHIGIPQKNFPFKYEMNGKNISGPLIIGGKLYAPFGICVFPFQRNIEVFIEIEPGITFDMLWNTKFGKKAITSKLYPAFYAAIRTGASFKGFTAFLEGNYDAILGFGVSLGIGYSFNLDYTPPATETKSLE